MIWQVHPLSWQREAITKRVSDSHMGRVPTASPGTFSNPPPTSPRPLQLCSPEEMAFWSHNQKKLCLWEDTQTAQQMLEEIRCRWSGQLCAGMLPFFFSLLFVRNILRPSNEAPASQTYKIVKNSVASASPARCTGSFVIPDCPWLCASCSSVSQLGCGLKWGEIKYKMRWYAGCCEGAGI